MSNRKIAGILIMVWSLLFGHFETMLFGYNWVPKSIPELICDFISLACSFYAGYLILTKKQ